MKRIKRNGHRQKKRHDVHDEAMENGTLRTARGYCRKIRLTSGHTTRNTQSIEKGETRSVRQHQWLNALWRRSLQGTMQITRITASQQALLVFASETSSAACSCPVDSTQQQITRTPCCASRDQNCTREMRSRNTWRKNLRQEAEHVHLGEAKHVERVLKSKCMPPEIWQIAAATNTL